MGESQDRNDGKSWGCSKWLTLVLLACSIRGIYAVLGKLLLAMPVYRFGELGGDYAFEVRVVGTVLWALLWGAWILLSRDEGERRGDRGMRVAGVSLLFSIALFLPAQNWDIEQLMGRSRYLYLAYWLLAWVPLWWLFLRRNLEGGKERWGSKTQLLLGAFWIALLGESSIDIVLSRSMRFVPDYGSAPTLVVGLIWSVVALAAALGFCMLIFGKRLPSYIVVIGVYGTLLLAHGQKVTNLKSPLSVFDTQYLAELWSVVTGFVSPLFLGGVAIGVVLGLVLFVFSLRRPEQLEPALQRKVGLGAFVLCGAITLGIARSEVNQSDLLWNPLKGSLQRGLVMDLCVGFLTGTVEEPPGYSSAEIERILDQFPAPAEEGSLQDPNLILLLVESLADPLRFGFEFTSDPMPFLRGLQSEGRFGSSISPVFGSQSANSEFELLTSMTMGLLPQDSLPYRQYIQGPLPSLPRLLGERGHRVRAIIVDPKEYFDRPKSYPLLGLDDVEWLHEDLNVARDITGSYASDAAVVERILAMSAEQSPYFAFAFSNASHAPYDPAPYGEDAIAVVDSPSDEVRIDLGGYVDSVLAVVDPPSEKVRIDLGGYANAVLAVDRAVEHLIEELRTQSRPTLVVILGDHMPPFSGPDGVYDQSAMLEGKTGEERKRTVPIWMWANYEIGTESIATANNFVALEALGAMGIGLTPFMQAVDDVRGSYRAFSRIVIPRGGSAWRPLASRDREDHVLRDYELLQYDLLFGERYYEDLITR